MPSFKQTIIDALQKKYEAQMSVSEANLKVLLENPVGVGDHPDIVETIDKEMQKITKAKEMLDKVGLGDRIDHYPSQLSGGEQQRVAIARAFIANPDILFADEPTGNLDRNTGNTITELLFELNQQQGTTLILVTHDLKLAERCQIQMTMEAGEFVQQSAPVELQVSQG